MADIDSAPSRFHPPFTGFAPSIIPAPTLGPPEVRPMSTARENADHVFKIIADSRDKTISGAALREATEALGLETHELRKAVSRLRDEGRIRVTGATRSIAYSVLGGQPGPAPDSSNMPAKQPDQFDLAERIADAAIAAENGSAVDQMPARKWAAEQERFVAALLPAPGGDTSAAMDLSIPLIDGATPELRLMAALDHVTEHFLNGPHPVEDRSAFPRVIAWLASKYAERC